MLFLFSVVALAFGSLPEESMDTPELLAYNGYPAEIHTVTTTDGYILTLHRCPYGKNQAPPSTDKPRPVVFLQHGLEASSSNWVTNLPTQSAAFIFADAGFDVWMGNFRGNTYSREHKTLSVNSKEFWQFSWDEMAKYDLPAMLNYVIATSGQPTMHYMGHSMGTMTVFALASYDQSWVNKIKSFHALGPVAHVGHVSGVLKYMAPFSNDVAWLLEFFGDEQFLPNDTIMKILADEFCGGIFHSKVCDNILFLIAGPESHQMNETRVPIYLSHTPAGTSTMNVQHFGQAVKPNTFAKFDWLSSDKNKEHYGSSTPPSYDITQVRIPTYLYWGMNDYLADPTDVIFIANKLPQSTLKHNEGFADFNHLDFIWGTKAASQVYSKVLAVINQGN